MMRWILVSLVITAAGAAYGAEHPTGGEHPSARPAEHPADGGAHTASAPASAPALTKEALARAIRAWVEEDARIRGGYLMVYDSVQARPLALTLVRVHEERLSRVGRNRYFACADFRDQDDSLYDLDFFMEGPDDASLRTTEITVHKKAGVARYNWIEREGVWSRVPVEEEAAAPPSTRPAARSEHPEHPAGGEHPR